MKNLICLLLMSFMVLMTSVSCKKETHQPQTNQPTNPPSSIPDTTYKVEIQGIFEQNLGLMPAINIKIIPIINQNLAVPDHNEIVSFDIQIKNDSIYMYKDNQYYGVKYDSLLILQSRFYGLSFYKPEYGDSLTTGFNIKTYRKIKQNQIIISDTLIYDKIFKHTYKLNSLLGKNVEDTINLNLFR